MLVGDGEVVERGGVGRVDFDRPLPAVDRLAPETALRDVDAELRLCLCIAPRICPRTRPGAKQQQSARHSATRSVMKDLCPTIATARAGTARQFAAALRCRSSKPCATRLRSANCAAIPTRRRCRDVHRSCRRRLSVRTRQTCQADDRLRRGRIIEGRGGRAPHNMRRLRPLSVSGAAGGRVERSCRR